MWQTKALLPLLGVLILFTGCGDATAPPESLRLSPDDPSLELKGIEKVTYALGGWYAYSKTGIHFYGTGFNIQAKIREYAGSSLLRESYLAEKGTSFSDYVNYRADVAASFDDIYVCGRNYRGWHRWEWATELPWTSPGAVTTGTSADALAACDCEDPTGVDYDPYADSDDCDTSGSGGSSTAEYDEPYEGAHTGGETVNFDTGMPDGGSSVCGEEAVLTYVCVDITYEDGATASKCGWATTC